MDDHPQLDDEAKRHLFQISSKWVFQDVYPHSVSFFCLSDHSLASGTLVEIGQRLFVATAAHTIPPDSDRQSIWLLPSKPQLSSERYLGVVNSGKVANKRPDVGFLELQPQSAMLHRESKVPCPLSRVKPLGIGRDNRAVSLIGSLGESIERGQLHGTPGLVAKVVSYSTVPFAAGEWPVPTSGDASADNSIDLFFDYPSGDQHTIDLETGQPIRLPDAPGTSGGGIWDQGFDIGKMWSPGSAVCFAIQSRWHKQQRYLRGVQVTHWLRLIYHYYRDLRRELTTQYPDIDFD
jgi:hypothetical protein